MQVIGLVATKIGSTGKASFVRSCACGLIPKGRKILRARVLRVYPSVTRKSVGVHMGPLKLKGERSPTELMFATGRKGTVTSSLVSVKSRFHLIVGSVAYGGARHPVPGLPMTATF